MSTDLTVSSGHEKSWWKNEKKKIKNTKSISMIFKNILYEINA